VALGVIARQVIEKVVAGGSTWRDRRQPFPVLQNPVDAKDTPRKWIDAMLHTPARWQLASRHWRWTLADRATGLRSMAEVLPPNKAAQAGNAATTGDFHGVRSARNTPNPPVGEYARTRPQYGGMNMRPESVERERLARGPLNPRARGNMPLGDGLKVSFLGACEGRFRARWPIYAYGGTPPLEVTGRRPFDFISTPGTVFGRSASIS